MSVSPETGDLAGAEKAPNRRRLQMGLRGMLILVLVLGLAFGWLTDHRRSRERLRQSQLQNEIYHRQLAELQKRLAERGVGVGVWHYWASSKDFITALQNDEDEQRFLDMASSLQRANENVFDESVEGLVELLGDANERTRRRAVISLRFMQQAAPERMEEHAAVTVAGLTPLLDDRSVIGEAVGALQAFGPEARPAAAALTEIMSDDQHFYAPLAAGAIAEIDPTVEITPRLIELIRGDHPGRTNAFSILAEHAPPEVARDVLTDFYKSRETEGERRAVINALNRIRQP